MLGWMLIGGMNKMGGRIKLAIISLVTMALFGCMVTSNKIFSEDNYRNSKPNRETREIYISEHPGLDSGIRNLIKNGIVGTGMSKEEVIASWGKPDRIEKTSKFDTDEMWYYWDNSKFHPRIYFSKGIVMKTE